MIINDIYFTSYSLRTIRTCSIRSLYISNTTIVINLPIRILYHLRQIDNSTLHFILLVRETNHFEDFYVHQSYSITILE